MNSKDRDITDDVTGAVSIGRRTLLRKAALTAPMIATIPSGAALARSSNLISGTTEANATDALGRTLCLDERYAVDMAGAYDLGEPPYGEVSAIRERDYYLEARASADPIREGDICVRGGTFYYREYGWQAVNVPRGMLVSATALSSFGASIIVRDI